MPRWKGLANPQRSKRYLMRWPEKPPTKMVWPIYEPISCNYRPLNNLSFGLPFSNGLEIYPIYNNSFQPTIKCKYCGNLYLEEIMEKHHNCPTCAGSWSER